jgi:predicted porin
MQKKIIALAVAGLVSGVAFAQSNVTVYGVADVGYLYGRGDNGLAGAASGTNKFSGIQSGQWSGSRVGFKGEEGLGNGVKAIFLVEFAYDIDSTTGGAGFNNNRQTYVGFDTPYGAFTAGRQYAPSYLLMGRNSSNEITGNNPTNQLQSSNGPIAGAGGSMTTNSAARWNNSFVFQSKDYSGFSSRVMYAFGETANVPVAGSTPATADTTDNGKFAISASYLNGPFNIDAIYQTQQNVRATYPVPALDREGSDINEWYLGGAYDFKVVKVMASYQKLKNNNDTLSAARYDAKVWSVGAIVPVGAAGKVRMEYARGSLSQSDNTGVLPAAQLDGSSAGYSLGYTHDLSKRTMLYTSIARMKNDSDSGAYGLGASVTNINGNIGAKGESNWSFLAGMRHLF